jgi:hypothetical protein
VATQCVRCVRTRVSFLAFQFAGLSYLLRFSAKTATELGTRSAQHSTTQSKKMATGERKAGKGMQFLFGGLSGMLATCVVQPLDLVKTRYCPPPLTWQRAPSCSLSVAPVS